LIAYKLLLLHFVTILSPHIGENYESPYSSRCPKCGKYFHHKLHRSWFVKKILAFIPFKKYFCANCKKAYYIIKKGTNKDD
jgi:DNA-directed RNA polymerase subunit RPC12/RpoP